MIPIRPRPRAAVIGAGFGGLALAIRLQSGGFDVTLIEKRDKPGGRAYVYQDQGFTFGFFRSFGAAQWMMRLECPYWQERFSFP